MQPLLQIRTQVDLQAGKCRDFKTTSHLFCIRFLRGLSKCEYSFQCHFSCKVPRSTGSGPGPGANIWTPCRSPPHHLWALQRVLVNFCVPVLSLAINSATTAPGPGQESCSHGSLFVRRIPFPCLACTVHSNPL